MCQDSDVSEKIDNIFCKHSGIILELYEEMSDMEQCVASLDQDPRQPRLAMEANGPTDTKTRERTEGAAKAVRAKNGDSCTAQRVQDKPKTSNCFGVTAEPPALPCRDDVLVENGAAAPKSYFPPLEMRSPTAAGGLLPTGEASIATRTTYNQSLLRLYSTDKTNLKRTNLRTLILSVSYDSSFVWKNNLPAAPSCRRIIETKSRQFSRLSRRLRVSENVGCVALW